MDFTKLTIEQVEAQLAATAVDVRVAFGTLDARQLNWRPSSQAWSVAQCLDHLTQANRLLCEAMSKALDPGVAVTLWQRLPLLPGMFGRLLVTSQAPTGARKFTAPRVATPGASDIDAGVIDRFVESHAEVAKVIRALAGRDPARIVMVSPFAKLITYSVLDGLRLVAAHERRHFEQARRVLASLKPSEPAA